jgi:hypothetical protein
MPINAEGRRARATLAATRRHRPDADTTELEADLERARNDQLVDEIVAAAAKPHTWTAEQTARLRRLFNQPAEQ